jgi:hypothetical protein
MSLIKSEVSDSEGDNLLIGANNYPYNDRIDKEEDDDW